MKKFFVLAVMALTVQVSAQAATTAFTVAARRDCDTDCAVAVADAKAEAIAKANGTCSPGKAEQITDWTVQVVNYGTAQVHAVFTCGAASCHSRQPVGQFEHVCREIDNAQDCGATFDNGVDCVWGY
ncbi:hypothetical protein [Bdellovibrio sp. NC01]|uniref:hypothetical protein n=1 Tax=Bdellovibrio sp. NC01 TaxID=2220073 RepID=UPI0011586B72|nr:hypothetical protein [Bdellovibrio sp. NC01]QDK36180.1 hypothetical protein DOE51_00450 [Bdellovibrio sp. NC01]